MGLGSSPSISSIFTLVVIIGIISPVFVGSLHWLSYGMVATISILYYWVYHLLLGCGVVICFYFVFMYY